jgi:hypothetical protein
MYIILGKPRYFSKSTHQMNVFSGKNALKDFYNPDKCPPLPVSILACGDDFSY